MQPGNLPGTQLLEVRIEILRAQVVDTEHPLRERRVPPPEGRPVLTDRDNRASSKVGLPDAGPQPKPFAVSPPGSPLFTNGPLSRNRRPAPVVPLV